MSEVKIDLSGRHEKGAEEVAKAFDILQKEIQKGNIKSFIMIVDMTERRSLELGVGQGETRSTLAMAGSGGDIMTMTNNLLWHLGAQLGEMAPFMVLQKFMETKDRKDITKTDGTPMKPRS